MSGNYAFVWTGTNGLQVIDVRDAANPRRAGTYPTSRYDSGVAIAGAYAYVVGEGGGLDVLDISDPPNLRRVGGNSAVLAMHVAASGDKLFVGAWPSDLMILNLFTPSSGPALSFAPRPRLEQNTFRASIEGLPGLRVRIERSADLLYWRSWTNITLGKGTVELSDPGAATNAQQFYHAVAR